MDIQIRPVTPDDAAGVVAIFNPIIESGLYTSFDTPFTVEAERSYIESMGNRDIFHVAVNSVTGRIVGFQSASPIPSFSTGMAHVGSMGTFIDLNLRRQGIGRRLYPITFQAAREKGYEKLFTYVRGDNPAALRAYTSHGFEIVGTAKRHLKLKDGSYVDEIIIEKHL